MSSENIHTDITLADVSVMLQIIDVCAKRGAFHPDEFVPIGNLSAKLKQVVTKATEDAKEATEDAKEATEDAKEATEGNETQNAESDD